MWKIDLLAVLKHLLKIPLITPDRRCADIALHRHLHPWALHLAIISPSSGQIHTPSLYPNRVPRSCLSLLRASVPPASPGGGFHPHLANGIHLFSPAPSSLSSLLLQLDLVLPAFPSNFSRYQCLVTSLPAGLWTSSTRARMSLRAYTHEAVNTFSTNMPHFLRYGLYSPVLQCSGFVAVPVTPAF